MQKGKLFLEGFFVLNNTTMNKIAKIGIQPILKDNCNLFEVTT